MAPLKDETPGPKMVVIFSDQKITYVHVFYPDVDEEIKPYKFVFTNETVLSV